MAVVHRSYKGMQPDHSDLMSQQWTGWSHLYVEHAQEVLDSLLMAYKIAEDPRVRIPGAVGYDGYVLSYTAEPVEIPDQALVDDWLPPNKAMPSIIPDEVDMSTFSRGWGGGDPQDRWKSHHDAILGIEDVLKETMDSFDKTFGRRYGNGMIEEYKMEDAEVAIMAMGTIAGTCKAAVDKMQAEGKKVGLIRLRSFIPFPENDLTKWAKKLGGIAVVDRSICPGKGGPVFSKVRDTLYDLEDNPKILQFHAGLGGKEVRVHDFEAIGDKILSYAKGGKADKVTWV
jgi:pyruvate ferredoxin oxidoreductase alpha subunit